MTDDRTRVQISRELDHLYDEQDELYSEIHELERRMEEIDREETRDGKPLVIKSVTVTEQMRVLSREATGLTWGDPTLRSINLRYEQMAKENAVYVPQETGVA